MKQNLEALQSLLAEQGVSLSQKDLDEINAAGGNMGEDPLAMIEYMMEKDSTRFRGVDVERLRAMGKASDGGGFV